MFNRILALRNGGIATVRLDEIVADIWRLPLGKLFQKYMTS